jgi:hypothetical protein
MIFHQTTLRNEFEKDFHKFNERDFRTWFERADLILPRQESLP